MPVCYEASRRNRSRHIRPGAPRAYDMTSAIRRGRMKIQIGNRRAWLHTARVYRSLIDAGRNNFPSSDYRPCQNIGQLRSWVATRNFPNFFIPPYRPFSIRAGNSFFLVKIPILCNSLFNGTGKASLRLRRGLCYTFVELYKVQELKFEVFFKGLIRELHVFSSLMLDAYLL